MNHTNLRRTLHGSASSRADSCVSTHVTRRKSPTTLSDARKTRRVWLMVIASTVGIVIFSGVVHAALGGGVCEGTGAPGCAYVDESGALMRGYGTVVDAAGGTNYDVKISYVGLQNWSGSTWWTPIATTGGVWQFESGVGDRPPVMTVPVGSSGAPHDQARRGRERLTSQRRGDVSVPCHALGESDVRDAQQA